MMLPLMHHGMLMVGIPYTEPVLSTTETAAARLTARAACRRRQRPARQRREKNLCIALGRTHPRLPLSWPLACAEPFTSVPVYILLALLFLCLAWELWLAPLRPGG